MKLAMMHRRVTALALVLALLSGIWALDAAAEETPSTAELEGMIAALEDEQAREKLIRKLRILADIQEPEPAPDVQTATGDLIQSISEGLAVFGTGLSRIARSLEQLPQAYSGLIRPGQGRHSATSPGQPGDRGLWRADRCPVAAT